MDEATAVLVVQAASNPVLQRGTCEYLDRFPTHHHWKLTQLTYFVVSLAS